MSAAPAIITALGHAYGSAAAKAFLAAVSEGEDGTSFNALYGGTLWDGSLETFPTWPGVFLPNGQITKAAGAFQFEPDNYNMAALATGRLSFFDQDQIQNAWAYAVWYFPELLDALGTAQLDKIPKQLGMIWPGGCNSGFPRRYSTNLSLVYGLQPPGTPGSPALLV